MQTTGAALGSSANFTLTIKCGTIASSGCTGATCTGCAGSIFRTISGTPTNESVQTCGTTEADGSLSVTGTYTVLGGGTCAANATCSFGYYDGGTFTQATGTTAMGLIQIDLKKNGDTHDTAAVLSATSTNGYLTGYTASTVSSGVASITGLQILKTAAFTNMFTLEFTALGSAANSAAAVSGTFKVRPSYFTYSSAVDGSAYVAAAVSGASTHTITNTITLTAKDILGNTCVGIKAADVIGALVTLQVGQTASAQDSSSSSAYANVVNQAMLTSNASLSAAKKCTFADGGTCLIASSDLKIVGHAGLFYRFLFADATAWTSGTITSANTAAFRLDPANLRVQAGDAAYAPTVIRVDGPPSNNLDVDGFHTAIQVKLVDNSNNVATVAACLSCMIVRLVKCSDNVPVASGSTGYEYGHTVTPCATVAQAPCAVSSGLCTTNSLSSSGGAWTNTLSSTTASTTANVVAGVATFANLQARFAVGAGYKLMFTFNPDGATLVNPSSQHTNTRGQQVLPATTDTVTR